MALHPEACLRIEILGIGHARRPARSSGHRVSPSIAAAAPTPSNWRIVGITSTLRNDSPDHVALSSWYRGHGR
jgi:hypothetical protein